MVMLGTSIGMAFMGGKALQVYIGEQVTLIHRYWIGF
jgi:hypothetical protein